VKSKISEQISGGPKGLGFRPREKIFTTLNMIFFLIVYDFLIAVLVYVKDVILNNNVYMDLIMMIFFVIITSCLTLCMFINIYRMRKTAHGNVNETKILNDLSRAAVVCCIQPILPLLNLLNVLIVLFTQTKLYSVPILEIPDATIIVFLIYTNTFVLIYEVYVFLDACVILFDSDHIEKE
jgi:uncharacterized membrane protein (DUF485 family)